MRTGNRLRCGVVALASLFAYLGCDVVPERNVRPIADVYVSTAAREEGLGEFRVELSAERSSDDSEVCLHKWDFGDGSTETRRVGCSPNQETLQKGPVQHVYRTQRGTFVVTLIVVDDDNQESSPAKLTLALRSNRYPVANFGVVADPENHRLVTFDAGSSADPDPEDQGLLEYSWVFGDGGSAGRTRNPIQQHFYGADGRFNVSLTVRDTLGLESTIIKVVVIQPSPSTLSGGAR